MKDWDDPLAPAVRREPDNAGTQNIIESAEDERENQPVKADDKRVVNGLTDINLSLIHI